jgi:NAD(P)-dependent dehydrogenase (short-subunit alcohol dehydrogenase family)
VADFDRIQSINVRGAFLVLQQALRLMLESGGGSIVNTASVGGFVATPGSCAHIISKGAMVMMTRQMGYEYAADGIRVAAVCPGVIDTALVRSKGPDLMAQLAAQVPQGRSGTPDEVANVALFLASDEASHVTGRFWIIDDGRTAG